MRLVVTCTDGNAWDSIVDDMAERLDYPTAGLNCPSLTLVTDDERLLAQLRADSRVVSVVVSHGHEFCPISQMCRRCGKSAVQYRDEVWDASELGREQWIPMCGGAG